MLLFAVLMLIISLAFSTLLHAPIRMSAPPPLATHEAGVLWDVDGTLVESTQLAFIATNEVHAYHPTAACDDRS